MSPSSPSGPNPPTPPPASGSVLQRARVNVEYLALGSKAGQVPVSLTTRSALNTARYVLKYALRRLLRYAKYAAVGAVIAVLGSTVLGTVGSGLAFFAAPGILMGTGIGLASAVAKFGWRHRGDHFRGWGQMKERAAAGHDGAADEKIDVTSAERRKKLESQKKKEDVWMRM